jgi:hypothetical protein
VIVSVLQFGILTFLLPLATILAATYFLPLGFGNPYLIWLLRKLPNRSAEKNDSFVVQLTRIPRQRTGLWSFLEDADDIGWLSFDESAVVFTGDAIQLEVPYELVEAPRQQTAGWRALFAYGSQTVFSIKGVPQAGTFLFAERGSFVLPTSRKIANRMYQKLLEKTERRDP